MPWRAQERSSSTERSGRTVEIKGDVQRGKTAQSFGALLRGKHVSRDPLRSGVSGHSQYSFCISTLERGMLRTDAYGDHVGELNSKTEFNSSSDTVLLRP